MATDKLTEKRSLAQITRKTFDLDRLFRKANAIEKLNTVLDDALTENLRGKFKIAGYRDGTLTLVVHSASLATRLKFSQSQLINKLRNHSVLKDLNSINIKVRPARHTKKQVRTLQPLSRENAQLLTEEAGQTKDEKLKNILLRLAAHTEQND